MISFLVKLIASLALVTVLFYKKRKLTKKPSEPKKELEEFEKIKPPTPSPQEKPQGKPLIKRGTHDIDIHNESEEDVSEEDNNQMDKSWVVLNFDEYGKN